MNITTTTTTTTKTYSQHKLMVPSRERRDGRGKIGGGGSKAQTVRYEISYNDIPSNMGNIANIS